SSGTGTPSSNATSGAPATQPQPDSEATPSQNSGPANAGAATNGRGSTAPRQAVVTNNGQPTGKQLTANASRTTTVKRRVIRSVIYRRMVIVGPCPYPPGVPLYGPGY